MGNSKKKKSGGGKKVLKKARETVSRELATLKKQLAAKDEQIRHLEGLVQAHDQLEQLARQELIDADRTIRAQESLSDMMARERIEADLTIKAQQQVVELSDQEKREADATIRAQERLLYLSDMEKKDAVETIRAHEALGELSRQEREESDRFFSASSEVSALSMKELQERDAVLRKLLMLNRTISAIKERREQAERCIAGIGDLLHAARGVIFGTGGSRPVPIALWNLDTRSLDSPPLDTLVRLAREADRERGAQIHVSSGGKHAFLIAPLEHAGFLSGVLCLVRSGEDAGFARFEQEVVSLFASQIAIYQNNAALFRRVREQNGELLRLINLKDSFIHHISDELIPRMERFCGQAAADPDSGLTAALTGVRGLVDRVLSVTSLEQEVEDLFRDNIDFGTILDEVAARHEPVRAEREVTVQRDLAPAFSSYRANRALVTTILDELYSNSVYYNVPGGRVWINGRVDGEYLVLEFADSGPGVPEIERERIFDQFYRMEDSEEKNAMGAGLGLFMVRNFAASYGGTVSLSPREGGGSVFRVSFLVHDQG